MKRPVVYIFGLFIFLMFVPWYHHTIYHDQIVSVGERFSAFSLINVHRSNSRYLIVGGHNYSGIRGVLPCYLKIPELNSILFVTQQYNKDIVFHIVGIKTGEDLQIDGRYATFGWSIGASRTNGAPYTDYIGHADSNHVIAVSSYPTAKKSYYLNLTSRKLDKILCEEFGSRGELKERSVYVDGELKEDIKQ